MNFTTTPQRVWALASLLVLGWVTCGCDRQAVDQQTSTTAAPVSFEIDLDGATWPGFRGGLLNGVAVNGDYPTHWTNQTGIRWSVPVPGRGNSSPCVWEQHIFLTSEFVQNRRRQLVVLCFDRQDGELLWKRTVAAAAGKAHRKNGYASATVATDGKFIVASFGQHGLFCLDFSGNQLWHADVEFEPHSWGSASSPIILDQTVVHLADGTGGSHIAGYDITTGQLGWKTSRRSSGSWTTPVAVLVETAHVNRWEVVVNGTGRQDGSGWRHQCL